MMLITNRNLVIQRAYFMLADQIRALRGMNAQFYSVNKSGEGLSTNPEGESQEVV